MKALKEFAKSDYCLCLSVTLEAASFEQMNDLCLMLLQSYLMLSLTVQSVDKRAAHIAAVHTAAQLVCTCVYSTTTAAAMHTTCYQCELLFSSIQ
jgi:hypothetical protein